MIELGQVRAVDDSLLDEIYAALPALRCKGKCQGSCGPLAIPQVEYDRLARSRGGAATYNDPKGDLSGRCSKLGSDGRCTAYKFRPLICRLYGMAESLRCPHGCVPERWVSDVEFREMLVRIKRAFGPALTSTEKKMAEHLASIYMPPKNSDIRLFG